MKNASSDLRNHFHFPPAVFVRMVLAPVPCLDKENLGNSIFALCLSYTTTHTELEKIMTSFVAHERVYVANVF